MLLPLHAAVNRLSKIYYKKGRDLRHFCSHCTQPSYSHNSNREL